jgi:dehydrogenase/reductase SDR family protein 7B
LQPIYPLLFDTPIFFKGFRGSVNDDNNYLKMGKVFIITGSSQGIGREIAWQLAQKGAYVVLNGRNTKKLEETLHSFQNAQFNACAISGDVPNPNDCEKIISYGLNEYGRIDYLINNAGISAELSPLELLSPDVFKKVIDINVLGSVNMTITALPHIQKQKGGNLFISSLAGIYGLPKAAAYSTSKMALTALAESLKLELGSSGLYIGIAYLAFVENDKRKVVLNKDGKLISQPKFSFSKAKPVDEVASEIINMIENRIFKNHFSLVGKIFYFMKRLSPWLLEKIMLMINKNR